MNKRDKAVVERRPNDESLTQPVPDVRPVVLGQASALTGWYVTGKAWDAFWFTPWWES